MKPVLRAKVAAVTETAPVSVVNAASRVGKRLVRPRLSIHDGRGVQIPACGKEPIMETFKKRQKEMRRLERRMDKAAKRKEAKARKAAGITSESEPDAEAAENTAASSPAADSSTMT